jgi:predicted RNase H-like HicB family nuclease
LLAEVGSISSKIPHYIIITRTVCLISGDHKTRKMQKIQKFTAIIGREDDGYVSLCPELDIASQGSTKEEAKENLVEAIELFLEVANPTEVAKRLQKETFVTQLEVTIG